MSKLNKSSNYAALELPEEFALSKDTGIGTHPKDFDWIEKSIPCQAACPAGTDVPRLPGSDNGR